MSRRSQKAPSPAVAVCRRRLRVGPNADCSLPLLAAGSLALYAPTWWYGALSIDDPVYVIDNVHVTSGLTARNIAWSFTSVYDSNWIPLTWISLMLDVDLYGGRASGFHITNTLLHAGCAVLLFWSLAQATGRDLPERVRGGPVCPASAARGVGGLDRRTQGRAEHLLRDDLPVGLRALCPASAAPGSIWS